MSSMKEKGVNGEKQLGLSLIMCSQGQEPHVRKCNIELLHKVALYYQGTNRFSGYSFEMNPFERKPGDEPLSFHKLPKGVCKTLCYLNSIRLKDHLGKGIPASFYSGAASMSHDVVRGTKGSRVRENNWLDLKPEFFQQLLILKLASEYQSRVASRNSGVDLNGTKEHFFDQINTISGLELLEIQNLRIEDKNNAPGAVGGLELFREAVSAVSEGGSSFKMKIETLGYQTEEKKIWELVYSLNEGEINKKLIKDEVKKDALHMAAELQVICERIITGTSMSAMRRKAPDLSALKELAKEAKGQLEKIYGRDSVYGAGEEAGSEEGLYYAQLPISVQESLAEGGGGQSFYKIPLRSRRGGVGEGGCRHDAKNTFFAWMAKEVSSGGALGQKHMVSSGVLKEMWGGELTRDEASAIIKKAEYMAKMEKDHVDNIRDHEKARVSARAFAEREGWVSSEAQPEPWHLYNNDDNDNNPFFNGVDGQGLPLFNPAEPNSKPTLSWKNLNKLYSLSVLLHERPAPKGRGSHSYSRSDLKKVIDSLKGEFWFKGGGGITCQWPDTFNIELKAAGEGGQILDLAQPYEEVQNKYLLWLASSVKPSKKKLMARVADGELFVAGAYKELRDWAVVSKCNDDKHKKLKGAESKKNVPSSNVNTASCLPFLGGGSKKGGAFKQKGWGCSATI